MMIVLQTEEMTIRTLTGEDQPILVKWLNDLQVLEYYEGRDRPHTLEMVQEHFYQEEEDEDVTRCIIEHRGQPIGYIQFYIVDEQTREEYTLDTKEEIIYGMDQFIGEVDYWNRGFGKMFVSSMAKYLTEKKQADRIWMDPQAWNARAIACYERSGFHKVKFMPEHEWHEGQKRDCWLMEYTRKGDL